ncbi:MAG: CPBP family intramembrane metalloprotease [candidate division Zixibacteria bacterium]|nr:CPBP family intramembrane metalloprotease [candidate division Zixibacteria bacterium]NIR64725.1 CPBP family intramembrane metalloprotease [candidate division Zixibacteria bacterium]NIS17063.1 CPBP family intramembrane metalloprotease [candidate division Zixibacteria bacterium]NIS46558.1 CPBP family intramembrane metalloprotease [candidate division Zixibacteria bacterium]NIT53433.1 CPBP family intramembrane metalloprotease [candidate division Zixibacteria bacterium]
MTARIDQDFKINIFSIILILFLCLIWPLSISLLLEPPADSAPLEIENPIYVFYLPTIGFQLIVLFFVFLVSRGEGSGIVTLGYRNFKLTHVIYAILFLFASLFLLRIIKIFLDNLEFLNFQDPSPLLPQTTAGRIVWILMCLVVALNEETAYRGYLITRLNKILRSLPLAVIIATAGFAAGHLYQGIGGAVLLFSYGLMFALLYLATKSLWPCVIAHFIHNALAIFVQMPVILPPFYYAPGL